MYARRLWLSLFFVAALACAQDGNVVVQVSGAVKQPLTLTADELAKMPRASVKPAGNGSGRQTEGFRSLYPLALVLHGPTHPRTWSRSRRWFS